LAETVKNTDDYAVVVGIDEYPGFRPLKGAVNDAEDFVKWLCEEKYGGALPGDNCKKVVSVKEPLAPLQEQIDVAFDSVFSAIPLGTQARRLYVYFSGHGMAESNLITDLCLASWTKRFPNRALDAQQYLDTMMKLGKFREIIMLLDCCRVRIVSAKGIIPGFNAAAPGPGAPKARYFLGNATEFLNSSYEAATADKGGADGPIIRGYFTRALMKALRGAAAIPNGGVPASKLKNYLEENVPLLAKVDNWNQDSEVVNGLKGDPIFGSAPPSDPPPGTPPPGPKLPLGPLPQGGPRGGVGEKFLFTLRDNIGAEQFTLLDVKDRKLFGGRIASVRKFSLRSGSYTLRTQFHHTTVETPIKLDGPLTMSAGDQLASAPELYSAAPLNKSPISHKYYIEPSQEWSRKFTRRSSRNVSSSLFIFIRAVDVEKHNSKTDLARGLTLLDRTGKQISKFSPVESRRDNGSGWLAFNSGFPEGTYFLRFDGFLGSEGDAGRPARELPLELCSGWQTQLFLLHRGGLLFETAKAFFARKYSGFRAADRETEAADVALNGLQSNRDLLTDGALNILFKSKFENPMLGLVAVHALLQRRRAMATALEMAGRKITSVEMKRRNKLKNQIAVALANLNKLLPDSSDVAALNVLAGSDSAQKKVSVDAPPMLRLGLLALMKEAATRPDVLKSKSLIPAIAPYIYGDTPWSMWAPLKAKPVVNWVHLALLEFMKKRRDAKRAEETNRETFELLATQLGVPQETVRQAAMDFSTIPASELWNSLPPEYQKQFLDNDSRTAASAAILDASKLVVRKADRYEEA
jgi:hypothetical protein